MLLYLFTVENTIFRGTVFDGKNEQALTCTPEAMIAGLRGNGVDSEQR